MLLRGVTPAAVALLACSAGEPTVAPAPVPPDAPIPATTIAAVVPETPTAPASHALVPPPPAEALGPCPEDMVQIGTACIDRYEAPNVAGQKPLLMQSALDGQAWCEARGKRLCREDEWVRACRGARGFNYPYGPKYALGRCNDDKTWIAPVWSKIHSKAAGVAQAEAARLDQSEPAGARPGCLSQDGVFDLTGNAAEWVMRTEDNETNHDHVLKGCYWSRCFRPPHDPACDYVNFAHPGGARSYEMSFRCCRAAVPR